MTETEAVAHLRLVRTEPERYTEAEVRDAFAGIIDYYAQHHPQYRHFVAALSNDVVGALENRRALERRAKACADAGS